MEYKVRFKNTTKVVYNGIDVHDFHPFPRTDTSQRRLMGIRDQDIVIGQVGSLIHRKGCDLVIRAFSKLLASQSNLKLVLVGSGEEHDRLANLVCKLGLESHVIFAGESDNTKLFFQEIFDVHVLASRSEALGRVLLEASACGLPTVASNCGGIPEVITHGRNGFLFSVDDYEDLSRQLMKLINDSSLRYHFGQNARDDTVRRFSIGTHIQKIQNSIQDICFRFSSN